MFQHYSASVDILTHLPVHVGSPALEVLGVRSECFLCCQIDAAKLLQSGRAGYLPTCTENCPFFFSLSHAEG